MLKDYTKENVARIMAKPINERTYKEKLIIQHVEQSKIIARIKAREGMA